MAPDAQLLLYYIREDNEVVATSVKFQIKSCFRNPVRYFSSSSILFSGIMGNLYLKFQLLRYVCIYGRGAVRSLIYCKT